MGVSLVPDYTDIVPTSDWMLYLYPLYLLCVSLPGDRVEGWFCISLPDSQRTLHGMPTVRTRNIYGVAPATAYKQQNKIYICAT